jgi:hypothetical protein
MQEMTLHLPAILDPRALQVVPPMALAPRLDTLSERRLLLFDNGKLHPRYGRYAEIFQTVAHRLQTYYGVQQCQRLRRDLLSMPEKSLRSVAEGIVKTGAEAVLLALCDSGVTAYTVVLAWELERQGIPTVTLCSGQCIHLAATMSSVIIPGLPLSQLNVQRHSSSADMAAESSWVIGEIIDGLTTTPEQLRQIFASKFLPASPKARTNDTGELYIWPPQRLTISAGTPPTATFDPADSAVELYETLCDSGLCDGLPVIPPTRPRVEAMLAYTDRAATEVLVPRCFPTGLPLTVQTLAINAVMAGCRPDYFPILLTAAEAVAEPRYRLTQAVITSHPAGNAIIVSGPLAQDIGLASAGGCLGPGFRANITIGRALTLALLNVGRALPNQADLSTFGSPAELAFCCAENISASPWQPFHVDVFNDETTSVTLLKCESPHNVLDHLSTHAEGILRSIADVAATLGGNNAYVPAELLVFLNPEHAEIIHHDGWSKRDVQQYLYEQARNPRQMLEGRGITPVRPATFDTFEDIPVVPGPEDILVVVAGTHGPHSMVGIPWGYSRAVTKPVLLRTGQPARHVQDFQQR